MRSSQIGQHKPHSASRSIMSDAAAHRGRPPHTTAPSNSISFYKTESVSPTNQCTTLPRIATQHSTRADRKLPTQNCPRRATQRKFTIARIGVLMSHAAAHASQSASRNAESTHLVSKKQNAQTRRATHDLQQAGTTCTAQHKSVSIDTVSLCVKHTNTIPTNRAHAATASDSPRPHCALEMSLAEL